jgi:hypothetical protein
MSESKHRSHFILPQSWNRLRSLIVYGTRMGPSGLRHIIDLGVSHLQTLTIGQTGMTHHFGGQIGQFSSHLISLDLDLEPLCA